MNVSNQGKCYLWRRTINQETRRARVHVSRGFRQMCDSEGWRELLQAWEGIRSRQNKLYVERHSGEMELGILKVAGNGCVQGAGEKGEWLSHAERYFPKEKNWSFICANWKLPETSAAPVENIDPFLNQSERAGPCKLVLTTHCLPGRLITWAVGYL